MSLSCFSLVSKLRRCCRRVLAQMGLVWRCLFALVFLFRGRKGSRVLVESSWLLRFQVNGWIIVICLLSIKGQVRMTECLIGLVKLWGASSRSILSLSFVFEGDINCHHSEWHEFTHHWCPWCGCFWLHHCCWLFSVG